MRNPRTKWWIFHSPYLITKLVLKSGGGGAGAKHHHTHSQSSGTHSRANMKIGHNGAPSEGTCKKNMQSMQSLQSHLPCRIWIGYGRFMSITSIFHQGVQLNATTQHPRASSTSRVGCSISAWQRVWTPSEPRQLSPPGSHGYPRIMRPGIPQNWG